MTNNKKNLEGNVDLYVNVLTSGCWPVTADSKDKCVCPKSVEDCIKRFE